MNSTAKKPPQSPTSPQFVFHTPSPAPVIMNQSSPEFIESTQHSNFSPSPAFDYNTPHEREYTTPGMNNNNNISVTDTSLDEENPMKIKTDSMDSVPQESGLQSQFDAVLKEVIAFNKFPEQHDAASPDSNDVTNTSHVTKSVIHAPVPLPRKSNLVIDNIPEQWSHLEIDHLELWESRYGTDPYTKIIEDTSSISSDSALESISSRTPEVPKVDSEEKESISLSSIDWTLTTAWPDIFLGKASCKEKKEDTPEALSVDSVLSQRFNLKFSESDIQTSMNLLCYQCLWNPKESMEMDSSYSSKDNINWRHETVYDLLLILQDAIAYTMGLVDGNERVNKSNLKGPLTLQQLADIQGKREAQKNKRKKKRK